MTENEWQTSADPTPMLEFLRGASDRKLRLFACACCRQVWDRLLTDWVREAVEASERLVDGLIEPYELSQIRPVQSPEEAIWRRQMEPGEKIGNELIGGRWVRRPAEMAREIAWETSGLTTRRKERQRQAGLLRCIFGSPFQPLPLIDASWLSWNDGTVPRLAQAIYDDRAFAHLGILADALEEAGCTKGEILDHCRSNGAHARGCWPVDLLLGKR